MATQFGPYELEELIGRGGMSEVHRAFDTGEQRTVALKLLAPQLAADAEFVTRFRREAKLVARLRDPHVIPIHRTGEIDGTLFIDMRLVDGTDLGEAIRSRGRLAAAHAVAIVEQVAAALDSAHAEGLVHRDVKPSNVLLTGRDGHEFCYLADFGIARTIGGNAATSLTATGATIGTLAYMAPERFLGQPADHRVDVYALGCLLHECLTGRAPFTGDGLPAMIHQHLNVAPPKPSTDGAPAALDDVVATAMAKDPDQRYPTAGALATAARTALDSRPATAPTPVNATVALPDATAVLESAPARHSILPSVAAPPSPSFTGWHLLGAILLRVAPAVLLVCVIIATGLAIEGTLTSELDSLLVFGSLIVVQITLPVWLVDTIARRASERQATRLRHSLEAQGVVFAAERADRWTRTATIDLDLVPAIVYRRCLLLRQTLKGTKLRTEDRETGTMVFSRRTTQITVQVGGDAGTNRSEVTVTSTTRARQGNVTDLGVNQFNAYKVIEHLSRTG